MQNWILLLQGTNKYFIISKHFNKINVNLTGASDRAKMKGHGRKKPGDMMCKSASLQVYDFGRIS